MASALDFSAKHCSFDYRGARIAYRLAPRSGAERSSRAPSSSPPVVLIHGLGSSSLSWTRTMAELSSFTECIAIDLPGFGMSDKNGIEIGMRAFGDTVCALLDELGIEEAVWGGHSMGGQVVLSQAIRDPSRMNRLVLIAPAGLERFSLLHARWMEALVSPGFVRRQGAAQIESNVRLSFHKFPEEAKLFVDARLAIAQDRQELVGFARACSAAVRAMLREPVFDDLATVDLKTLIVFGENDRLIPNPVLHRSLRPADIGAVGREKIAKSRLVMVPEAGHMVHFEKADLVNAEISAFLAEK